MEIWKDIKGYEGVYQISNLGNVWSIRNKMNLKPILQNIGYYTVGLTVNGNVEQKSIHRLVLEAFVPNPNGKPCCNHKDAIKTNNRVSNLEWCTWKENTRHAVNLGLIRNENAARGEDSGRAKLTEIDVFSLREKIQRGDANISQLAREYNMSRTAIRRAGRGISWSWLK